MSEQPKDPRTTGHGWVTERPDGMKAKCGGPGLCVACKAENDAVKPPVLGGEPEVIGYAHTSQNGYRVVTDKDHPPVIPGSDWLTPVELVDRAHVAKLQAEVERLNALIADLAKDKERIDSIEANYWDVRHSSSPIADTGDHSTSIEIVGHWMDKPHERVIGENYSENLRGAIDQAMSADPYPPERPEYPEIDAALAELSAQPGGPES